MFGRLYDIKTVGKIALPRLNGDIQKMLFAMTSLQNIPELELDGHINHIIGCNEETGHECIKYYLTKEKCPDLGFSPDGMFPVIHAEKHVFRAGILICGKKRV